MNLFWILLVAGALALIIRSNVVVSTGLSTTAIRGEFFNAFDATSTRFQDWSTRIPSTGPSEKYRWLGTVPQMREWGSGRLAKGLRSESYDVENLKYEATIAVDRDEIADDQLGQIRIRVNELAGRAATHKDYMIGQLLINGATAGFKSYDGLTFFNALHVSGASGNQDNALTPAAVAPTAPTTAEFRAALSAAIAAILAFKDDQGEPMVLDADGLNCVVPPSMRTTALEAVNATIIANTSNVLVGAADVVAFPWLSTATTWYLLKTNGVVRPFIFQDREPIEFNALGEGSEEDFKREKFLYGVRARYRMTYGYWQYAVRNVFT
ncbi:MAG TPA: Mu-like prophage major head subunit gpT family protein [Thermoguttaceae bacterium]|nr:Mu-like prophage major head subunit gpT family protein [Thermoguttaceae bacterium]